MMYGRYDAVWFAVCLPVIYSPHIWCVVFCFWQFVHDRLKTVEKRDEVYLSFASYHSVCNCVLAINPVKDLNVTKLVPSLGLDVDLVVSSSPQVEPVTGPPIWPQLHFLYSGYLHYPCGVPEPYTLDSFLRCPNIEGFTT